MRTIPLVGTVVALVLFLAPAASAQCTVNKTRAALFVTTHEANSVYRNVAVSFRASGTPTTASPTGCHARGTKIIRWEYDWDGDGSVDQTVNDSDTTDSRSHIYTALKSGNTAQVRATDDLENTSGWSFVLFNIVNKPPTASLTHPGTAFRNETVTLSGSGSSDVDGPVANYRWDTDGDGVQDKQTTTASTTVSFGSLGSKPVGLRVADGDGALSPWKTSTVTILNKAPTAAFSCSPPSPLTFETITCTSTSKDTDTSTGVTHYWDTGSGSTQGTATKTARFSRPGTYQIGLKVVDGDGGEATATRQVTVGNRLPVAGFSVRPYPFYTGQLVTLTSTSSDPDGTIVYRAWDLDDDGAYDDGTTNSATVRFPDTAPRTVRLLVKDDQGAVSVRERTLSAVTPPADAPVSATIDPLPIYRLSDEIQLSWTPSHSGAVAYDVRRRTVLFNRSSFSAQTMLFEGTEARAGDYRARSGHWTCFSVRAYNAAGAVSAWSAEQCVATPADDPFLAIDGNDFKRVTDDESAYRGTLTVGPEGGVLRRDDLWARTVYVMVNTCAECGVLIPLWNGAEQPTIDLTTSTSSRRVIRIVSRPAVEAGALELQFRRDPGETPTVVDGIIVSRR